MRSWRMMMRRWWWMWAGGRGCWAASGPGDLWWSPSWLAPAAIFSHLPRQVRGNCTLFCETFTLTFEKVNPNNNRALGERRMKPENYGTRYPENFSFVCLLFKYSREIRYLSFFHRMKTCLADFFKDTYSLASYWRVPGSLKLNYTFRRTAYAFFKKNFFTHRSSRDIYKYI